MIRGDGIEYDKLAEWVKTLPIYSDSPEEILTCEIGVREGLGSKIIMDGIRTKLPELLYKHIAIDPYNNLKYQHYDTGTKDAVDFPIRADYTDEMRQQMEIDLKGYPEFKFHHMTDTEFMNRSREGTRFIFDDYVKYSMDQIAFCLTYFGFKTIEAAENKICLERKK